MNALADFIAGSRRLVALTGAGCSTRSGIPDYRSPGGVWNGHKPVYFREFMRSEDVRRAYWARSLEVWPRFNAARPNETHFALAELESRGALEFLITQNVDDLHGEAGSRRFVQLHGRNRVVICVDCGAEFARAAIQERIVAEGVPACERCGGILKPHVVFFGETVPQAKVAVAMQRLDEADALVVVGSSLQVWSGFRFVRRAAERRIPIAIVNIGPTRADHLATLRIDAECGETLRKSIKVISGSTPMRQGSSQNPVPVFT
ncbi:MAG TPA: Sir2 family NAD-dependent protein deacetylase [Thermoanaerobaculia bacterium]|nr:Sir2 family NAD-dependent protein deacetylase [Thermoanaerobaculia bacterium]